MIPRNRYPAVIAAILVASLLVLRPHQTQACGPFFTSAIFVYSKHPDFPLDRFAHGEIGVLQESYARSYLVAAYRTLNGEKLTDKEAAALKGLWDDRLTNAWESHDEDWIKKWNEARAKVQGAGPPPEIRAYRNREKPNEYETYLNCQQDAFETAEATLNERSKRFGADSPNVLAWLRAQDTVFNNCGEGAHLPDAAAANADALTRADRAYQIAAAHFYAAQFDDAGRQFDAIAHDASSPWRDVAGYLAARSLLRKGSLAEKPEQGRPALAEAENRLKSVLNDKSLSRSHHAAKRLLNLTLLRLRPEEKLHELSQAIVKKGAADDFKQTVWDYTVLLDKFVGEEVKVEAVPQAIRGDDLTDWILTFQDETDRATAHALERWEATRNLAWLVAAISKAAGKDAKSSALIDAAAKVDSNSNAFPSLVHHTVRLLIENNRAAEARTLLDRTLAGDRKGLTASGVNFLLSQRMVLSQNLEDFLKHAQHAPAGFSDNNDGREIPDEDSDAAANRAKLFFDWDAVYVFNRLMPTAMLGEAARSQTLAPSLHRDVAQAAFMRAALLDDRVTAQQAATTLVSVYPELKEFLDAYRRAATPDARRFAAAYLALKYPGLRPYVTVGLARETASNEVDSYRDNWWCAEPATSYENGEDVTASKGARVTPPEFLRNSQIAANKEAAALRALGTGPNYLAQTVINWGAKNPGDTRMPEALHLAVKSTRYGCTDKDTGRWSKAAFDFLHRRYPNTSWAKETKYWFKD